MRMIKTFEEKWKKWRADSKKKYIKNSKTFDEENKQKKSKKLTWKDKKREIVVDEYKTIKRNEESKIAKNLKNSKKKKKKLAWISRVFRAW